MHFYITQNYYCLVLSFFLICSINTAYAQNPVLNKYGLPVISSFSSYLKTIESSPSKKMVSVIDAIPGVLLELKYAGTSNFMQTQLYPTIHNTYLRQAALDALKAVQARLQQENICIKIWDAYRPYSVTEKMWDKIQDERYTANPVHGSGHNRGIAIDLTLVDRTTGKELEMGTAYDNFSDTAHHGFIQLPQQTLKNRILLKTVMEQHGFKALETEWWHYYLPDSSAYEILDLSFESLHNSH